MPHKGANHIEGDNGKKEDVSVLTHPRFIFLIIYRLIFSFSSEKMKRIFYLST